MCSHCGCDDKKNIEDKMKHFEEHLKSMSKEELGMKKEKLEKKLALVKILLTLCELRPLEPEKPDFAKASSGGESGALGSGTT